MPLSWPAWRQPQCSRPVLSTWLDSLVEQVRMAVVEADRKRLVQEPLDARHERKLLAHAAENKEKKQKRHVGKDTVRRADKRSRENKADVERE